MDETAPNSKQTVRLPMRQKVGDGGTREDRELNPTNFPSRTSLQGPDRHQIELVPSFAFVSPAKTITPATSQRPRHLPACQRARPCDAASLFILLFRNPHRNPAGLEFYSLRALSPARQWAFGALGQVDPRALFLEQLATWGLGKVWAGYWLPGLLSFAWDRLP